MLNKLLALIIPLLSALAGCGPTPKTMNINYEKLINLDAEDLAEAGIGDAYTRILPELKAHVADPLNISEVIEPETPRYAVRANGKEYVVYSQDVSTRESESWGAATYVFFKIINDQLNNTTVRFYAFYNGNDLGGMFLTPQQADEMKTSLPRPSDWPYLPNLDGPWHGQHH